MLLHPLPLIDLLARPQHLSVEVGDSNNPPTESGNKRNGHFGQRDGPDSKPPMMGHTVGDSRPGHQEVDVN